MLQAELPYKSKPKNMAPRKRPTLEQRRAVVLEPGEKKAVTLVQQLNALRNVKEAKRKEQQARKREVGSSSCIMTCLHTWYSAHKPVLVRTIETIFGTWGKYDIA